MSNFKSGSGNLDFGSTDDEPRDEDATETTEKAEAQSDSPSPPTDQSAPASKSEATSTENQSEEQSSEQSPADETTKSSAQQSRYPYFVRRSNVGDERDTRLEIHVRDKVVNGEAKFRNNLAEHLGTSEVSKTDAREFALLAAFQHPERVAELMREEGFGALD